MDREGLFETYLSDEFPEYEDRPEVRDRFKAALDLNYGRFLRKPGVRVLDIGPGFGELIDVARGYRPGSLAAIDVSREAVDACNAIEPGVATLVPDSAEYLRAHEGAFDAIFMLHVLEHLPKGEVVPMLAAVRSALADDGVAIVEVPNMTHPIIGQFVFYDDFTHEVGFTETSLRVVLGHAGFDTIQISGFKEHPDWAQPVQRLAQALVEGATALVYRAYGMSRSPVTAASLWAAASAGTLR